MDIKPYQSLDLIQISKLFYQAIHQGSQKDYTKVQLDAWTPSEEIFLKNDRKLKSNWTYVAWEKDQIIGFGDIDAAAYLGHLFVHPTYLRRGVASKLCDQLEQCSTGDITTDASITAKSFFEKRGYRVIKKQQVLIRGILLTNYKMIKER